MKVIAGIDEEYDGTLTLKGDIKVGYLAQEPQLDPTKTVRENILDGIQDKMRELHALDQVDSPTNTASLLTYLPLEKGSISTTATNGSKTCFPSERDQGTDP